MAPLEIAFFDVETTIPSKKGDKFELLEFAAVVLASKGFFETLSYSTLIRPPALSLISPKSVACNGITQQDCADAPAFPDVADRIFGVLHGKVWAGHNIARFDILRVRDAFERCNRPAPEPLGVIDTLPLLRSKFGMRAGNLKMSRLAEYCGLGNQQHRASEDCRMNIEVLKHCAAMLFLESNFSEVFAPSNLASAGALQTQAPAPSQQGTAPKTNGSAGDAALKPTALKETSDASPRREEPSTDTVAHTFAALSIANGTPSKDTFSEIQEEEEGNGREGSAFERQSFEGGFPQAAVSSPYSRPPAEKETDALTEAQMGGSERLWKGPLEEERLRFSGNNERDNRVVSWLTQKDSIVSPWQEPLKESPALDAFRSLETGDLVSGGSPQQGKQPPRRRLFPSLGKVAVKRQHKETHISVESIDTRHFEVFRIASEQALPDEESSEAVGDSSPEKASAHRSAQSFDRLAPVEQHGVSKLERFESLDDSCFSFPVSPGVAQSLQWLKAPEPIAEPHREPTGACFQTLKKYVKRKPGRVNANGRNNRDRDTAGASRHSAAGSSAGLGSRSRSEGSLVETLDKLGSAKGGLGKTGNLDPPVQSPSSPSPIALSQTDYASRHVNKLLQSVHEHVASPEPPLHTNPSHTAAALCGTDVNKGHVTPALETEQQIYGDRIFKNPGAKHRAAAPPLHYNLRRHSFSVSQGPLLLDKSPRNLSRSGDFGGSFQGLLSTPQQSPADVLEKPCSSSDATSASEQRSALGRGAPDLVPAFAPWEVDTSSLQCVEVARSKGSPQIHLHFGDQPLQIHEQQMRLRFSVGDLYTYDAIGRPTFSVLGEPSNELRDLMDGCDALLRAQLEARGIQAEWRPSIIRKEGEADAIRIRIGALGYHQTAHFTTQFMRQKRATRGAERLPLGVVDPLIFRSFFPHGCLVDVVFTVETYNVDAFAGTRLVASQLTLL